MINFKERLALKAYRREKEMIASFKEQVAGWSSTDRHLWHFEQMQNLQSASEAGVRISERSINRVAAGFFNDDNIQETQKVLEAVERLRFRLSKRYKKTGSLAAPHVKAA